MLVYQRKPWQLDQSRSLTRHELRWVSVSKQQIPSGLCYPRGRAVPLRGISPIATLERFVVYRSWELNISGRPIYSSLTILSQLTPRYASLEILSQLILGYPNLCFGFPGLSWLALGVVVSDGSAMSESYVETVTCIVWMSFYFQFKDFFEQSFASQNNDLLY